MRDSIVLFLDTFDSTFKNNCGSGGWFEGNIPYIAYLRDKEVTECPRNIKKYGIT